MTTTPVLGPVDDLGRLVHEADPAAQLALALSRLESLLAAAGRAPASLTALRLHTTDTAALEGVLDVLVERLADTGAHPVVSLLATPDLGVPGMLVALEGEWAQTDPDRSTTREGPTMSAIVTPSSPPDPSPAAPPSSPTTRDAAGPLADLQAACEVHLPGEPGYDATRSAWNASVDQRPAAVAVPRTVAEVQAVVTAAASAGLRVAPQSTGHAAGPLAAAPLGDTVLVRLHELTGVVVDVGARTARVTGGTLWRDVVEAAAPHGLAALHGSAADVAVAGYILNGGLSFYARAHGLAATSVVAVEVVLAEGRLVRADADHEPDLFWALRGGGGNFGVVVAIELALLPVADVYAGMLVWDAARAPAVVAAWVELTRQLPESVTLSLRVMRFPPLPDLPPFLSGRHVVVVDGAVLEDDTTAAGLLGPLRALAPEVDTFGRMPAAGLLAVHMDPPGPTPTVGGHSVLGELDDDAVAAFLDEVGPGTDSPLLFGELRHLGGAIARPRPTGGAVDHVAGGYALLAVAVTPVPEAVGPGRAAAAALVRTMEPWAVPACVLTFAEERMPPGAGHSVETLTRLRAVRDRVDPRRVMRANHEL